MIMAFLWWPLGLWLKPLKRTTIFEGGRKPPLLCVCVSPTAAQTTVALFLLLLLLNIAI
ncbi:unnamed protein product [Musa acuminata subsp. malaccensis]|nr:unnamed protein product [Musa acuminata subsp. malaccensis]